MAEFYSYVEQFFKNWFLYMTAGPFVADEILLRLCPNVRTKISRWISKKVRRRIEAALLLIGVFYAGFAAFKEERKARETAESALHVAVSKPVPIPITETDAEARARLQEQQKRIEELEGKLTEARREIAKQQPVRRTLTDAQHKTLVEALKAAGSYSIAIRSDPQTPETQNYSDQFESVFKEAGWTIVQPMFLRHLRAETGLHILVHDANKPPEQANKLYRAMLMAGLSATGDPAPGLKEDSIELMIGFPSEETTQPSPSPSTEASPH